MEVLKAQLMDEPTVLRTLMRMAHEITEKNKGVEDICLVGVHSRGVPLAEALRDNIEKIEGTRLPCGSLDISFYRDDRTHSNAPVFHQAELPFSIADKKIVLVDDVLYTGRTVRAAIEALFSLGRPRCIQLAILIDRGHRELPIRADYVGKSVPTSESEQIRVQFPPFDEKIGVQIYQEG